MLHSFRYHDPTSLSDATAFLAEHGPGTAVFSGGTDLFVTIRAGLIKPEHVLNLKGIEQLHQLTWSPQEGLSIGACVTVNQLVSDQHVQEEFPVLVDAGEELATFQLRNRATVVGNIVTASPCGDMASPLLVLGGEVVLTSPNGQRRVPLQEFITGVKRTIIAPDEIVERIVVPPTWARGSGGYEKLKRIKGHDLGVVSVAMLRHGSVVRAAVSSAAPTPVLLPDLSSTASVADVQTLAQSNISPIDDVRATAEYRSFMVNVFIERLMTRLGAAA